MKTHSHMKIIGCAIKHMMMNMVISDDDGVFIDHRNNIYDNNNNEPSSENLSLIISLIHIVLILVIDQYCFDNKNIKMMSQWIQLLKTTFFGSL